MDELTKDRLPDAYSMIGRGMDMWYEQIDGGKKRITVASFARQRLEAIYS